MTQKQTAVSVRHTPVHGLAVNWVEQLERWMQVNSLTGYDPFDIKQHPLIRAAQPYFFPRKLTTALSDLFPMLLRKLLRVEKTDNPKAYALAALGRLRRYQVTGKPEHLEEAVRCLEWLQTHPSPGYDYLCWGYPFNVFGKGVDTPRHTPIAVVSVIAGEAFLLAYEITQEPRWLESAQSITRFLLTGLPRLDADDGTYCFAYTPSDRRRVHNASLLSVSFLAHVYTHTRESELLEALLPALQFSVARQRTDGSWAYGEYDPNEPYEPGQMKLVDHHHTGFVLRALHESFQCLCEILGENKLMDSLARGYMYYITRLFNDDGMPVTKHSQYPVDIHACSESILCPSALTPLFPEALAVAEKSLLWAYQNMRNAKTGAPYYRQYPGYTSRAVFTRWGVAWIYYALCEYLYAVHSLTTSSSDSAASE